MLNENINMKYKRKNLNFIIWPSILISSTASNKKLLLMLKAYICIDYLLLLSTGFNFYMNEHLHNNFIRRHYYYFHLTDERLTKVSTQTENGRAGILHVCVSSMNSLATIL